MLEFARVRKDLATGRYREKVLNLRPESEEDKIDDAAAGELASVLAEGNFDKAVDLSGNSVTEQGLLRLTEVLGPVYPNVTCSKLVLRGNPVRNRGAHAVAQMLVAGSPLSSLDVSDTRVTDDGLGYLAQAILHVDPLEELYIGRIGHHGLEYLVSILESSKRLRRFRAEFVNVETLHHPRKTLLDSDFDYSEHTAPKNEEEEAGDEEAEEEAARLRKKKEEKMRKWLTENTGASDDEACEQAVETIPPHVDALLNRVLEAVVKRPQLEMVELTGPGAASISAELARLSSERQPAQVQEQATGGQALLEAMIRELTSGEQGQALPVRGYFRHTSAISAALFECQRFKAGGNTALSTSRGELAFVAMQLRQHLAQQQQVPPGAVGT